MDFIIFFVVVALKFSLFQVREWEVHVSYSDAFYMCTSKKSPIHIGSLNFAINLKAATERSIEIWLLNVFFIPGIKKIC